MICCICKKRVKFEEGGCIPADSRGAPDESRALCGICRPKLIEDVPQRYLVRFERPYRTKTGRLGHEKAIIQPFKRAGTGVQINQKFIDVYGSKALREFDKEAADYYEKKGK